MTENRLLDLTDRLILYLVDRLTTGAPHLLVEGGGVLTTMLAKLLFLTDVWMVEAFSSQATSFRYIRYKFGPYPLAQLDERLEKLQDHGLSATEKVSIEESRRYRIYRYSGLGTKVDLPANIKLVADEVMTTFATQRLEEVLAHVYSLDAVRKAAFGEPIDLDSLSPKEDAVTRALTAFGDVLAVPPTKEHNDVVKQAEQEKTNENIEMARVMIERQLQAFRLKQGS